MKEKANYQNENRSHISSILVFGMGCSLGVLFHNIPLFVGGGIVLAGLIETLSK
ncbi:TPA: hypothetical protein PTW06_001896 [Clostridium botulinum]|uniref:hypothetical protein n=1 Tax=Clostridium botulinum TaxID=1491 RepID=UPI0029A33438|nr:hypothetical protein [Clostridium botulinum]HDK7179737.1 hypothetical protein [Clostridium botulinum]HDK7188741.1 hypothetical protein [Clostridium botulinum]HDK7215660.1 hypothetical protein [Clostridium botulinum]HDK7223188.1 hypothetical protein [Clostridium botulinum]